MVYQLKLPLESIVHPVFHVSLLKNKVEDQETVASHTPQWELLSAQEPVEILATRVVAEKEEMLIHWKGDIKEEASWETKAALQSHYPDFPIP